MNKYDKVFYAQTMAQYKTTCEWWGIDIMSMYDNIERDYPNAAKAIQKMHSPFDESDYYVAQPLHFEHPRFVYEAIANLIPTHNEVYYNMKTTEQNKKFKDLNMCSWSRDVSVRRMDLIAGILLFAEEFILQPLSSVNVTFTDKKLTVYSNLVTFKVSKHEEKTYVSIRMKDVILLEFVIHN